MIIKGKARAGAEALGNYLLNAEKNERVKVLELKNTVARDLVGALTEMDAYKAGTRCQKALYHAIISPEPPHRLSDAQCIEAVDALEAKLGLDGHARAILVHEKFGREHLHIVWTRIDLDTMKAVPMSHSYRKHEQVARDLEDRFGHPRVKGAHDRDGDRPDRSPTRAEIRQAERTGIPVKEVKAEVTALFEANDNAHDFCNALEDAGYVLAKGDKRDFVIVDPAGGHHSLPKRIAGMKVAELRAFMAPIDRDALPTVEDARNIQLDRATVGHEMDWDDALAASAIAADDKKRGDQAQSRKNARAAEALDSATVHDEIVWDEALAVAAIAKAKKTEAEEFKKAREEEGRKRAGRGEALVRVSYAHGESMAGQNSAALGDFKRRGKALNAQPRPLHPDQHAEKTVSGLFDKHGAEIGAKKPNKPALSKEEWKALDRPVGQRRVPKVRNFQVALNERMAEAVYGGEEDRKRRENEFKALAEASRQQRADRDKASLEYKPRNRIGDSEDYRALGDTRYERFAKQDRDEIWEGRTRENEPEDPNRQQEAPGGGRARSR